MWITISMPNNMALVWCGRFPSFTKPLSNKHWKIILGEINSQTSAIYKIYKSPCNNCNNWKVDNVTRICCWTWKLWHLFRLHAVVKLTSCCFVLTKCRVSRKHISHIFLGAHRPRPFLPHDFSKDFQDCILNPRFLTQRWAFSNNPRHMLPHPFCGSALHSGHCPWHSMAFFGETWRRNMQTVPPHAPHHRIKYQTWNILKWFVKTPGTVRISQHTCATLPNLHNSNLPFLPSILPFLP